MKKTIVILEVCTFEVVNSEFRSKQKTSNLGAKMSYLSLFDTQFWKLLSYLQSASLRVSKCKYMWKKKKNNLQFALFQHLSWNWKNCCHIWNQYPQNCQKEKFHGKQKNFNFRTKLLYVWYFLGYNFEKLLPYLKSALSSFSKCKFSWKRKKTSNVAPKMSYLGRNL